MSTPTPADFEDLVEGLFLNRPAFDYVVVADGSGTTAGKPCGYYAAVYDCDAREVAELRGGSTTGTNNLAELSPFLLAFWHIQQGRRGGGMSSVLCVSDSEVTVHGGTGRYSRNANRHLWAGLDCFVNQYDLVPEWHYIPRNSHPIHERADAESKKMRKRFEGMLARGE